MVDKLVAILNVLAPGAVLSAVGVAAIKAWSNRPENLARAKKINIEADGPVILAYQKIVNDYEIRLDETEARWEKRFNEQADHFSTKIEFLEDELKKCRRSPETQR